MNVCPDWLAALVSSAVSKIGNWVEWFQTRIGTYWNSLYSRIVACKLMVICAAIWGAMRFASGMAVSIFNQLVAFKDQIAAVNAGAAPAATLSSMLAKLNCVFPVAESFVMCAALGGVFIAANAIRFTLAVWKAIPLKAS